MVPTPNRAGVDRVETARGVRRVGRPPDEDVDLADDEDWIAVQEF